MVATQASSTWNFAFTEHWVFPRAGSRRRFSRYLLFLGMNNSILLRVPFLALLTSFLGINYLVSNLLTLVVLSLLRSLVSGRLIWKPVRRKSPAPTSGSGWGRWGSPGCGPGGCLLLHSATVELDGHG